MLDGRIRIAKLMLKQSLVWYHWFCWFRTFSFDKIIFSIFQVSRHRERCLTASVRDFTLCGIQLERLFSFNSESSAVSAQLWAPPKTLTGVPLMVIYKKTFSTLCYISRPNDLQNKISSLQTQFEQNQACSQVLRFGGEKYIFTGKDFNIYHMFETNFSEHNKIWGHKKIWG